MMIPFLRLTRRSALKSKDMSDAYASASDAYASASGILIHACCPFPNVQDVTNQQASARPWKLDSIRHVFHNNKWRDTKVEFQMNGKRLVNNSVIIIHVVFTDDGLKLAHFESALCDAVDGNLNKKKKARKVLVKYNRVLHTENAIELCESEDHHSTTSRGIRLVSSLGTKSLRRHLEQRNTESRGNAR
jgi:hypothetical protein